MRREGPHLKYARVESELRFLLDGVPDGWDDLPVRRIHDRYIEGTRLRLRAVEAMGEPVIWKLGHKVRFDARSPGRIAHTSLYLDDLEAGILSALPAIELVKTRRSRTIDNLAWAVDEFLGPLVGLVLAEVDVESASDLPDHAPFSVLADVSADERFTGFALARLPRDGVVSLVASVGKPRPTAS